VIIPKGLTGVPLTAWEGSIHRKWQRGFVSFPHICLETAVHPFLNERGKGKHQERAKKTREVQGGGSSK
jgi:hypothetical protein